jgi:hypothetical protein
MDKQYEYVIVGGGPTGLTLALYLSKYNKRVALLEKGESLGGCHSVKRVDGLFTEHGPRIYLENYLVFKELLKNELNTNFSDLFTEYKYGNTIFAKTILSKLSIRELFIFGMAFLNLNDSYKHLSFKDFLDKYQFSDKAKDILDRVGRLTDGGGIEQYTLFSFMQLINQNLLYSKVYEPRRPNDVGLFKIWREELVKRGVDIYLNSEVNDIHISNNGENVIEWISTSGTNHIRFYGSTFIFATPPYQINQIFQKTHLQTGFRNNFSEWSKDTNYITYIPVVFHWNKKFEMAKAWGYPQTSWGVGYIVMSDYMEFDDTRSKIVISSLITMQNKSDYLDKTPNEISNQEVLINEVFRQLKTILGDIPMYDEAIMSQNIYNGKEWVPLHTAFMTTTKGYLPCRSNLYRNLYNCGVQNGKSDYVFTSMESSVVNAIELVYELVPESKGSVRIRTPITFRFVLFLVIILSILLYILFKIRWGVRNRRKR